MTKFRLKISQQDLNTLRNLVFASLPNEAGAFALAGISRLPGQTNLLVRRPISIPHGDFIHQSEARLEISTGAINGLISLCEANNLGAVVCHSHPGGLIYSPSDDYGEKRLSDTIRNFIPQNVPVVSLLFSPDGVTGRVWLEGQERPINLAEIIVLGRTISRIDLSYGSDNLKLYENAFSRQVQAFGRGGQEIISKTKVGIVGVGGTGSAIAEQLARLGTRDFVLIDPDHFEPSNVTRVYGTFRPLFFPKWWGVRKTKLKVNLIRRHLKHIDPRIKVKTIAENVVKAKAAHGLLDRDVIFLCTDDHWGRSIVNQISYQYLIPTINLGTRIAAKENRIIDAVGVVDILSPDYPCLWCRQFLRADRIATESMPESSRKKLEREGYVENLDDPTPSVVSFTTGLAGLATTQYLQLLIDFMGSDGEIQRLTHLIMEGTVRRGEASIQDKCICRKVKARGELSQIPTIDN